MACMSSSVWKRIRRSSVCGRKDNPVLNVFSQKFYRTIGVIVVVLVTLFFMVKSQPSRQQMTQIENCLRNNPTYTVDGCRALTEK